MTDTNGATTSVQELIDRVPNLVEHFRNDTRALHFSRAGSRTASLIPPAFTNWRDEQRSWSETAALLHQSHHMPELFINGPDSLKVVERLGIGTVDNFAEGRAKQFISCTPTGHVIGDCIAYRLGPESFELVSGMPLQNWVQYNAEHDDWDVEITRDPPSNLDPSRRRSRYRFQLDGPSAGNILATASDNELQELKFFHTTHVSIKGHDVLVLRHGMAGYAGVELSGPFEEEAEVREAILVAGEEYGIVPVGTLAYFSTVLSNAWMSHPVPGVFTDGTLRGYREWLPGHSWEANIELGGSYVSANIEDYYVTPYDLGYGHIVKFDHDFVGRESLEGLSASHTRKKVVLVWDSGDVQRVYASQFGSMERFKSIEAPRANYAFNQLGAAPLE